MEWNSEENGSGHSKFDSRALLFSLWIYCSDVISSSINSLVLFCRLTKKKKKKNKKLIIRCQQRCRRRLKRFPTKDKRFFSRFFLCHSHWLYIHYCTMYPLILFRMLLLCYLLFCFFFVSHTKLKIGFYFRKSFISDCKFLFFFFEGPFYA